MSPPQPVPVITLRLSQPQLLDAVLSADGHPLYSFETARNNTTLLRCIPETDGLEQVAQVQWPQYPIIALTGRRKDKDNGVRVQIAEGHLLSESEFLRISNGVMHSSRKFNIPGLDRSLKWRRTGSQGGWECTSPTTSTPVATFEPANLTSPAKIKIYCTDIVPPQRNLRVAKVNGVCTLLMDYIVLTTLLLLTNKDDWKMLAVSRSASVSVGSNSPSSSSPVSPISPITPFSANQSPSMPTYDARSWYSPSMGNGTLISHCSSNASSYYGSSSATGTFISVRSTASSRHRPRTSPSSSTLSSLTGSSSSVPASTQQRAVRRAASQFVRPGSQWSSNSASKSTTVPTASNSQSSFEYEEEEEEEEESPVLDIRPTQDRLRTTSQTNPHSRSYSYDPSPARTPSPAQTPTRDRALRVQVPTTPMVVNATTMSAAPILGVSAYTQQLPFLKTDPAELPPPPPYEEIEWTVRLKTPRRARSTIFGQ